MVESDKERITMPKYEVLATNHTFYSIEIEADTADEALFKATNVDLSLWSNDGDELEIHQNPEPID